MNPHVPQPARLTGPKIVAAALHLVSSRGLEEVTVRAVAAEAGVSIGAVQHHFRTKDELLAAAMAAVTAQFKVELAQRLHDVDGPESALRAFLYLIAVLDDDTGPGIVWAAFAARACVDPAVRATHSREWLHTEKVLRDVLVAAYPDLPDPDDVAATLLALTDGIAVARAAEESRMSAARGRRLIDAAVDRLHGN